MKTTVLTVEAVGPCSHAYLVDGGRPHRRAAGIAGGGAADPAAARAANDLLDQAPTHCCLEVTLRGGRWLLSGRGQFALTGADMNWRLNGNPVDRYSLVYLDGDYLLTGGTALAGCRAYLGIRGRWQLPQVLGSVELGVPGAVGLAALPPIAVTSSQEVGFRNRLLPTYPAFATPTTLTATPGPEWNWLGEAARRALLGQSLYVDPASNRQGIRLRMTGVLPTLPSLISSPVLPGTVQLTPAGPILLGPDAQTVGGYPRVLHVRRPGPAFQLRPGQALRFRMQP